MSKINIDLSSNVKIIVPFNIAHTPRAYNLINFLAPKVKNITLITCKISGNIEKIELPFNVETICLFDLRKKSLDTFIIKLRFKISRILLKKTGIESYDSVGYGATRFLKNTIKNLKNDDIIFCFKEVGLLVGTFISNKKNVNTIFDFEDWFSEDLIQEDRKFRPLKLIRKCEGKAISKGNAILVPSIQMKLGFEKVFGKGNFFNYYNSFNLEAQVHTDLVNRKETIKLVWFSQVVSFNRGLEDFFDLLSLVNHVIHIDLIGKPNMKFVEFMENKFKTYQYSHTYKLHGFIEDKRLDAVIANADFGLGLEKSNIISRDLTITYKCFRYIANAVPVILSNTKGQEEFASITQNIYPVISLHDKEGQRNSAEKLDTLFLEIKNNINYYNEIKTKTSMFSKKFNVNNILNKIIDVNNK